MNERGRGGLLRQRDFALLWAGQSVSEAGTAVTTVVLPLIAVVYLRASAFEVGLLAALAWAPWLLVGLPAGAWVDRRRKRPVLVVCDLVRAVLFASVPIVAATGALTIGQLFVVAFASGLATVGFQVAYPVYLPFLVARDDLAEGNAKLQGSESVAVVAGPGIGGVLVQVFRAPYAVIVDAVSYLVSALALLAIRAQEPPAEAPTETPNLRREIADGIRFVRHDPFLSLLTVAPAIGNFAFIGFDAISVLFLVRTVRLSPAEVGVLLAVVGTGAMVGAALARPFAERFGTSRALWLSIAGTAPFALLIPLTTAGAGVIFFIVGNFVVNAGVLVYAVNISAFRQRYVPRQLLGRVVASMRFVMFGAIPLGALTAGALASSLGPRSAVWILVLTNLGGALILVLSPLRRLRDLPDQAVAPTPA